MKVAIIGTGNVGLVTGACLASSGHEVTCVDIDARRVAAINARETPFYEAGLAELLEANIPDRLTATEDLRAAVLGAEVTILAVGTPNDGSGIDLSQIETAAVQVGRSLRDRIGYHLVIVKSTVLPGTTDERIVPLLEAASGRRLGEQLGVAMNPEFLREGQAVRDFLRPDRIVMGGSDERAWELQEALYAGLGDPVLVRTSNATAEAIKYASNALLATMISFSNEIANVCSTVEGVDGEEVLQGVHLDRRLTSVLEDGSRVEPGILSYLLAGCGFGGSCLPKDVRSLVEFGRSRDVAMDLLGATLDVNRAQPERVVELVERGLGDLAGRRVAILGLAFKPETSDIRETPAIPVAKSLAARGAELALYDPAALEAARAKLGEGFEYAPSLDAAIEGAEAIVVLTRWSEFADLAERIEGREPAPLVVDGRRMLDPSAFARYEGIGVGPERSPDRDARGVSEPTSSAETVTEWPWARKPV